MRQVVYWQVLKMFGYLTASQEYLTEDELARYKAAYCGLCHSLKERHGRLSCLTLNYDMVFLVLFLGSLYEPEEKTGASRCLPHLKNKRAYYLSRFSDYAADMTVALAYLKCLDDWIDDKSLKALFESGVLKNEYNEVKQLYPRQCSAMEETVCKLSQLEKEGREEPDAAAAIFGSLMGELFVYVEDRWAQTVFSFGDNLGRFIYLLDACMDLETDVKSGNYNPFRKYSGQDNETIFRQILKLFLSDAVQCFNRLPLVQDAGLMNNILCAGLWSAFNKKFQPQEGISDDTGSV